MGACDDSRILCDIVIYVFIIEIAMCLRRKNRGGELPMMFSWGWNDPPQGVWEKMMIPIYRL